jgi:hypothetical protein
MIFHASKLHQKFTGRSDRQMQIATARDCHARQGDASRGRKKSSKGFP